MKLILSFLGIFILSISNLQSQVTISNLDKKDHVVQLESGTLFVQLPNSDKKIKKLEKSGNQKLANAEKKEVEKLRNDLLTGFPKEFNFCNVYFIEASSVNEVVNGNFENVMNSNLEKISNFIQPQHTYILRHGRGNPKGEVYSYNGEGLQIRHVTNNQLEAINSDMFFVGNGRFKLLRRKRNWKHHQIKVLNTRLTNAKMKIKSQS